MSEQPTDPVSPASEEEVGRLVDQVARDLHYSRLEAAEAGVRQLLELAPESTTAHELHGDVLRARGQASAARQEYRRAVELEPANADAERKYAELALQLSERDRARDAILSGDLERFRGAGRKDPAGAASRSLLFPGLGQLYNGDYELGLGLALAGFGLLAAFLLLFLAPLIESLGSRGAKPGPGIWGTLSLVALLALYGYSAYQAYRGAPKS